MKKEVDVLFLKYFEEKGHKILDSSSVSPQDHTLLFTNAGMVQFKDWFLDTTKAKFTNVATCQNCIRAGGKHNDLDNVGKTNRHHTYFKMLGNFSFGGYFKQEAIDYAWDFLTNILGLDKTKLYATHYHTDNEARNIWMKHLPKEKIVSIDTEDNFWSMGDVGPCGPCSEIFYDLGENTQIMGGNMNGSVGVNDRWIEIWNLVFMQFNRKQDGKMEELTQKCVDTGASVERLTAILEGKNDTYETSIFNEIISQIPHKRDKSSEVPLRVIADHLRCIKQTTTDKVDFSNEGRGYVARKILRRAMNFWLKLFNNLENIEKLPILKDVSEAVKQEVDFYNNVLKHGIPRLENIVLSAQSKNISAEKIFELHDTFGLHINLIDEYLQEYHPDFTYDRKEFENLLENQRKKAQKSQNFELQNLLLQESSNLFPTKFIELENENYAHEVNNVNLLKTINFKNSFYLVFDKTVAYAESGGQVSDQNVHISDIGYCEDVMKVNDVIFHKVDSNPTKKTYNIKLTNTQDRAKIRSNHTATHLLHKVLMDNFKATQKGSLVNPEKIRFDFNYIEKLSESDILLIESEVLKLIHKAIPVKRKIINKSKMNEEAGLVALFDEKYGEELRVLKIEDNTGKLYSKELCCGTHVLNTEEIEFFKVISCESISKGVSRIEALTGLAAKELILNEEKEKSAIKKHYKISNFEGVLTKIQKFEKELKDIQQKKETLENKFYISEVKSNSKKIKNVELFIHEFEEANIRNIGMQIAGEEGLRFICLANKFNDGFFIAKTTSLNLDFNKIFEKLKKYDKIKCGFSPKVIQGTLNGIDFKTLTQEILEIL